MDFYTKVKGLCEKRGISITELTTKLGLGGSLPSSWRSGSVPRPSTIKKIADFFKVDISYFNSGAQTVINSNYFSPDSSIVNFGDNGFMQGIADMIAEYEASKKAVASGIVTQEEVEAKRQEIRRKLGYDD